MGMSLRSLCIRALGGHPQTKDDGALVGVVGLSFVDVDLPADFSRWEERRVDIRIP